MSSSPSSLLRKSYVKISSNFFEDIFGAFAWFSFIHILPVVTKEAHTVL